MAFSRNRRTMEAKEKGGSGVFCFFRPFRDISACIRRVWHEIAGCRYNSIHSWGHKKFKFSWLYPSCCMYNSAFYFTLAKGIQKSIINLFSISFGDNRPNNSIWSYFKRFYIISIIAIDVIGYKIQIVWVFFVRRSYHCEFISSLVYGNSKIVHTLIMVKPCQIKQCSELKSVGCIVLIIRPYHYYNRNCFSNFFC